MRLAGYALLLSLLVPVAAEAGDLTITIGEVKSDSGSVLAVIYDSEAGFGNPQQARDRTKIKAKAGSITWVLHDLKPGKYAISTFHDENDNGKLDRNAFGIPSEGYGFSNDARGNAGPPKFAQAAFDFDGKDQSISISLDYP